MYVLLCVDKLGNEVERGKDKRENMSSISIVQSIQLL